MDKHGSYFSLIALLPGIFVIIIAISSGIFVLEIQKEATPSDNCNTQVKILTGINGIEDYNSGLFSGGSATVTNLAFKDGTILNYNRLISQIKLNEPTWIKICRNEADTKDIIVSVTQEST